jgi:hypothetical protein
MEKIYFLKDRGKQGRNLILIPILTLILISLRGQLLQVAVLAPTVRTETREI